MHVGISVSIEATHVRFTATGTITPADFVEARATLRSDARWDRSLALVMDLSPATDTTMTSDDVRALAGAAKELSHAKRIIIAPRAIQFGFARMFQSLAESRELADVTVVKTLDDALAMLARR